MFRSISFAIFFYALPCSNLNWIKDSLSIEVVSMSVHRPDAGMESRKTRMEKRCPHRTPVSSPNQAGIRTGCIGAEFWNSTIQCDIQCSSL